jgi:hypothetical protein
MCQPTARWNFKRHHIDGSFAWFQDLVAEMVVQARSVIAAWRTRRTLRVPADLSLAWEAWLSWLVTDGDLQERASPSKAPSETLRIGLRDRHSQATAYE